MLSLLLDSSVQYSNCTDYDVQLVNGPSPNEGTLQICRNGVWGTVCDNKLSSKDAGVICHQLGYPAKGTCSTDLFFTRPSPSLDRCNGIHCFIHCQSCTIGY